MALICGGVALLLLLICVASTYWLHCDDYRQGLWEECRTVDNAEGQGQESCTRNDSRMLNQTATAIVYVRFKKHASRESIQVGHTATGKSALIQVQLQVRQAAVLQRDRYSTCAYMWMYITKWHVSEYLT